MRIPWWLRNPDLKKLQYMVDGASTAFKNIRWRVDDVEVLKKLPEHYQKAFWEARTRPPRPVHYRPAEVTHVYDPETGITKQVDETQPILPLFPPEANYGLWGGEGIIKGFSKRTRRMQRNPRWWFPKLHQAGLYTEILDKHYLIWVTGTTMMRIDEAHGFDNYILKTHEVDLKSRFGMRLKREMLLALCRKTLYPHDPEMRDSLLEKYKEFIIPEEEAEWVGLTLEEAVRKHNAEQYLPPVPLKDVFQDQFLLELSKRRRELIDASKSKS